MLQCVWQVVFLLKKIIIIKVLSSLCWKDYLIHTYVRPKIWKIFCANSFLNGILEIIYLFIKHVLNLPLYCDIENWLNRLCKYNLKNNNMVVSFTSRVR
jgi:hypothetical protein